jgi:thiol-disulfide isomerase/thioredoxin
MAGKKLACLYCAQLNRVPFDKLEENPKCGSCGKGLMPNKAVDITAAVLDKARANDDVPLIVDFWAPWCGPCVAMAPEFNKAAKALAGKARLVKVNTQTQDQGHPNHDRMAQRPRNQPPRGRAENVADHQLGTSGVSPEYRANGT